MRGSLLLIFKNQLNYLVIGLKKKTERNRFREKKFKFQTNFFQF